MEKEGEPEQLRVEISEMESYWTTLYKGETTDTLFSFDSVISEVYSADYLFSICTHVKIRKV